MENKEGWKTYTIPVENSLGITDLISEYAFHGNSQGDDSATNSVSEYIASEGWKSVASEFKDIDYLNQSAVDKRAAEIKLRNSTYIDKVTREGNYGKETTTNISLVIKTFPVYDTPAKSPSTDSYRLTFLDFSNGK